MSDERESRPMPKGWTYPGVFAISLVLFLVLMGVEMIFYDKFGLISHVGIVAVSVLAAFMVRVNDASAAIWAPSIVWFLGLITVGQIGRARDEFTIRGEIFHIGYGLANHAIWIVSATFLSWLIVIIRRARY